MWGVAATVLSLLCPGFVGVARWSFPDRVRRLAPRDARLFAGSMFCRCCMLSINCFPNLRMFQLSDRFTTSHVGIATPDMRKEFHFPLIGQTAAQAPKGALPDGQLEAVEQPGGAGE